MTDLEKDLAIYKAMLGFANEIFSDAVDNSEVLRKLVSENGNVVTTKQLTAYRSDLSFAFNEAISLISGELLHIEVGSFSCTLEVGSLFYHLEMQKQIAKVKGDIVFTYEEKIQNEFAGTVEVNIGDCNNAKLITKHCASDELRPIMNYVIAEINATTQTICFIASDGHSLCVLSNNKSGTFEQPERGHTIYQALFTQDDWKRICDYAKKNGGNVLFDIYRMKGEECFDTFNVHLGDICLRSRLECGRYPNWHSVIPSQERLKYRFSIVPEERKDAQNWVKNLKDCGNRVVNISFYRGSDLVYFEYENLDFSQKKTATFHLTRLAQATIGVAYSAERMKKIKFTGFNLEKSDHATIVDCEEAELMLVMPFRQSDGYVFDVENRERPYVFSVGEYAAWQTLNNDAAIVRIEAISGETACIRTVGWNRYRVPLSELQPTVETKYTWPSWLRVGQNVSSEKYSGRITELGRTYVTIDNHQYVSYRDIINAYSPSVEEKVAKVVEMKAA